MSREQLRWLIGYKALVDDSVLVIVKTEIINLGVKTIAPIQSANVSALPEFGNWRTVKSLYGFSRSYSYLLASQGLIRSVCIRKPGALKGKRLFDCASIREFIQASAENA